MLRRRSHCQCGKVRSGNLFETKASEAQGMIRGFCLIFAAGLQSSEDFGYSDYCK